MKWETPQACCLRRLLSLVMCIMMTLCLQLEEILFNKTFTNAIQRDITPNSGDSIV